MSTQNDESPTAPPLSTLVLGVVLVGIGVGAFLALVLTGHKEETGPLLGFLSAPVTALLIVGYQRKQHQATEQRLDQQDKALTQITRQTNGVLDQRIRENSKAALQEILQEHLR